jgi:hypothetical protein
MNGSLSNICKRFQTREVCLKSLVHESKVLDATLFRDVIIAGCQFGLLVFWDLTLALKSPATRIDFNDVSCLKILVSISPTKSSYLTLKKVWLSYKNDLAFYLFNVVSIVTS